MKTLRDTVPVRKLQADAGGFDLPLSAIGVVAIAGAWLAGWYTLAAALFWLAVVGLLVGAISEQARAWLEALGVFAGETADLVVRLLALGAWIGGMWLYVLR